MNASYLSSQFNREVGKSLPEYVSEKRIAEAKRLLRTRHAKIYEICTAVGYPNSQYFSQVFYKKVGMYPAEYRKTGRDEA